MWFATHYSNTLALSLLLGSVNIINFLQFSFLRTKRTFFGPPFGKVVYLFPCSMTYSGFTCKKQWKWGTRIYAAKCQEEMVFIVSWRFFISRLYIYFPNCRESSGLKGLWFKAVFMPTLLFLVFPISFSGIFIFFFGQSQSEWNLVICCLFVPHIASPFLKWHGTIIWEWRVNFPALSFFSFPLHRCGKI